MSNSLICDKTVLVIGAGNLGSALVRGFACEHGPKEILVYDRNQPKIDSLADLGKVRGATELDSLLLAADIVVLAVKPDGTCSMLKVCADLLKGKEEAPLFISVAAFIDLAALKSVVPSEFSVLRAMPNFASRIGEGVTAIFGGDLEETEKAVALFALVGVVSSVKSERQFDAIAALSAAGQAFVAVVIEALADGGVKMGLPREQAIEVAAKTVSGAGGLVLRENLHPALIKDAIASPGGTTIAGLHVLEQNSLRGTLISAVEKSTLVMWKGADKK